MTNDSSDMMPPNPALFSFISPYDDDIQSLTIELRNFVTELVPYANELIWDNYNAVAIGFSRSQQLKDAFCHIAVYAKHVNFGFNRGADLRQNILKLNGTGKLIRHVKVIDFSTFPSDEIKPLILEAVSLSEAMNPNLLVKKSKPVSKVMSISEKKIRPSKNTK